MLKRLAFFFTLFLPAGAFAQVQYEIVSVPVCWNDSSLIKYTYVTTSGAYLDLGYFSPSGAPVTVSGGTLRTGFCPSQTLSIDSTANRTFTITLGDQTVSWVDSIGSGSGGGGITSLRLGELTDVDTTGEAAGSIILYDATSGNWEAQANNIDNLTDAVFDLLQNNQVFGDTTNIPILPGPDNNSNLGIGRFLFRDFKFGQENILIGAAPMFEADSSSRNVVAGKNAAGGYGKAFDYYELNKHNNSVFVGQFAGGLDSLTFNTVMIGEEINMEFPYDAINSRQTINGVGIGSFARMGTKNSTHEIVIGAYAVGKGDSTVTLGLPFYKGTYLNGNLNLNGYGVGNKEATDLTKARSRYIAAFATDGTLLELDTTGLYASGATTLNDLTDVVLTNPQINDVLKYNGTNWVNDTLTISGGGGVLSVTANNGLTNTGTSSQPVIELGGTLSRATTTISANLKSLEINRPFNFLVDSVYLAKIQTQDGLSTSSYFSLGAASNTWRSVNNDDGLTNQVRLYSSSATQGAEISSYQNANNGVFTQIELLPQQMQIVTPNVNTLTATAGQVLKLVDPSTGEVEFAADATGGGFTLPTDSITFNDNNGDAVAGKLQYDTDYGTLVFGAQNNTPIHIGSDMGWYVKNQTGSPIAKGVPVYASGTDGASGRITVAPMIANNTIPAKFFLGVTAEAIANGADGFVWTHGKIRPLSLTGFSTGDVLYVSPTSAGTFTTTEPTAPNLKLPVGFVVNNSATGTLAVRATIGNYLAEAHDVQLTTPSNGQALKYDGTKWVNGSDLVNDADADPTNEIQDLSLSGNALSLSGDASMVDLSGYLDDQTVSLTGGGITVISGTYPNFTITSTEVDGSTTNELQTLSLSGNTLSISGGNSVNLSGLGGSGIDLTDLSVTVTAAGSANLSYNNTNGVFTYTPPDLTGYLTSEVDGSVSNEGVLSASTVSAGSVARLTSNTNGGSSVDFSAGTGIAIGSSGDNTISITNSLPEATTASNGLTEQGNDIKLGGTLTGATTITMAGNDMTFTGTTGSDMLIDLAGSTTINSTNASGYNSSLILDGVSPRLLADAKTTEPLNMIEFMGGRSGVKEMTLSSQVSNDNTTYTAMYFNPLRVSLKTPNVVDLSAQNGQFLQLVDRLTGEIEFANALSAEVDGSVSNEGALSIGTGVAGSSVFIQSNTSTSTPVTISVGNGLDIAASGSTIFLNPEPFSIETGTSGAISWGSAPQRIHVLDFGVNTSITLSFTNVAVGGIYTLRVTGNSGTDTLVWPGTAKFEDGTSAGTVTLQDGGQMFTFYWDGTNYWVK